MADPCLGEIRIFAGSYAPENWHLCDGALLPVSSNQQLYSLIGNTYGGTSGVNFALPDLRSRVPISQGQGPELSARSLAQSGGTESVTLEEAQMPAHTHALMASTQPGTLPEPAGALLAQSTNAAGGNDVFCIKPGGAIKNTYKLAADALSAEGNNGEHENRMPSTALTYIICLVGLYPTFT